MNKRAIAAIAVVVIGLAVVLYALLSAPNDEERIREKLAHLADVVSVEADDKNPVSRGLRMKQEFSSIFTEDVNVSIPELTSLGRGRDGLASVATRAGTYFETADISLSVRKITFDERKERAQVESVATLTGSRAGELEHDTRAARFDMLKQDGDWMIDGVAVTKPDE